jgi:DMSO/TMAO reductase YedYZ molybdopterin-dependent catalytic subunit
MVGAAVALAVGQLASAVIGVAPSPLLAVDGRFVDRFAASLKEFAVETFGTNDKPALVIGTVIIALALGAVIGVLARRRGWIAFAGLGAFGAFGALAQTADPRVGAVDAWATAVVAVVAGALTIRLLLSLAARSSAPGPVSDPMPARPPVEPMPAPRRGDDPTGWSGATTRRGFIGAAGVLTLAAAGAAAIARGLTHDNVLAAVRRVPLPRPTLRRPLPDAQPFTVEGVSSYITPARDFYRIDTALNAPRVDPSTWRLQVGGLVDRPFTLTYEQLLALPSVEEVVTLQCVSNDVGGNLVGNARWQGVPLADLLDRAGVRSRAEQVFSRSVDGWTSGFPLDVARDGRIAMVAYAMNGERLPLTHGFPARLVVSGLYGYVSATKWLESITLTTWDGADGYWVPRGWSKEAPIKLTSRIDVPRAGERVPAGTVALGGVAWAPSIGVSAVEVSIDDGPWLPCELGRVASEHTWVQWRLLADVRPGRHVARVRATDANGRRQIVAVQEPAPDGATGLHRVSFTAD